MDEFTQAYIECALWASTDDEGEPLYYSYSSDDFALQTLADMVEDCKRFQNVHADLLAQAYGAVPGYDTSMAGHDFWLTRNHHGAGFWDRGLGEAGEALTKAAHMEGSRDLYIGDDGKVYAA